VKTLVALYLPCPDIELESQFKFRNVLMLSHA
jgi:hypothetical protein